MEAADVEELLKYGRMHLPKQKTNKYAGTVRDTLDTAYCRRCNESQNVLLFVHPTHTHSGHTFFVKLIVCFVTYSYYTFSFYFGQRWHSLNPWTFWTLNTNDHNVVWVYFLSRRSLVGNKIYPSVSNNWFFVENRISIVRSGGSGNTTKVHTIRRLFYSLEYFFLFVRCPFSSEECRVCRE